jgi:hypothetical protein
MTSEKGPKRPRGRPPHEPTEESRRRVTLMIGFGNTIDQVALIIGTSPRTLKRYYKAELQTGYVVVKGQLETSLFKNAMSGNQRAIEFALTTRFGYRVRSQHEIMGEGGGPVRTAPAEIDLTKLSDDQLAQLEAILAASRGDDTAGGSAPGT